MKALVLAGGQGSRLRPLTPTLPKPLAPVANRPVLSWVLDHLDRAGVEEIGVIVPVADMTLFRRIIGSSTPVGTPVRWLPEAAAAGTGGCLRQQAAFFGGGPVLVVPADIVSSVDLARLVGHHHAVGAAVTVAVVARDGAQWSGDVLVPDPARPGTAAAAYRFKPGGTGRLRGSTGAWIVEPDVLDWIPAHGFTDFSSQTLPALPMPGLALGLFDAGEIYLRDIGTPAKLLTGNQEAAARLSPLEVASTLGTGARIDPSAHVGEQVLIGEGAQIAADVRLTGPAVIGPHARIGAGVHLNGALVLPGAQVDAGTRVTEEIVGDPAGARDVLLRLAAGR
ncbi:sugar phosphate nucleotidyltransferase [Streptomyces sp. NPDC007088]|uniref:sugar phosphate nucleotidyltransferase n=1 Tax=Streptomyces sp. NPDC007088 TaxID=3364773 RepID=UPI0036BC5F34